MIIDALSDLHFDYYFKEEITKEKVGAIFFQIFMQNGHREVGDVLVIAGDIGHYNDQNIEVLRHIKEIFGYKHIVCVLGNHDYFLFGDDAVAKYEGASSNRTAEMRELINSEDGMYCLDGNIVEIKGVKFGGCDGWYDGEYIREHFGHRSARPNYLIDEKWIDKLWFDTMFDGDHIYDFDWKEHAALEKRKIEKIYKEVDVMVTHINPSIRKEHTNISFREEETTGFWTFKGEKFLLESNIKVWFFGHTHNKIEFELHGTKCICSPLGKPKESNYGKNIQITSFKI